MKRTIKADENPLTIKESYFADAKYHKRKKTSQVQPKEVQEALRESQPPHPSANEEVIEALKGLTLPLTQPEEVSKEDTARDVGLGRVRQATTKSHKRQSAWIERDSEDATTQTIRHQKLNSGTQVRPQAVITRLDQKGWPTTMQPRRIKNTPGIQEQQRKLAVKGGNKISKQMYKDCNPISPQRQKEAYNLIQNHDKKSDGTARRLAYLTIEKNDGTSSSISHHPKRRWDNLQRASVPHIQKISQRSLVYFTIQENQDRASSKRVGITHI
ncbi:hypothetical protein LIER_24391 [Lithospermum erythrorhizon]|uniref:Uncharacterized protein n=1 Tax=Lithospermum erythrorhizon TaxID=34254 RepID=A0AAV3R3Z6_LITER